MAPSNSLSDSHLRGPLCERLTALLRSLTHLRANIETPVENPAAADSSSSTAPVPKISGQNPPSSSPLEAAEISQSALNLQTEFQAIISAVIDLDIDLSIEQRLIGYQTEAHRKLRLISLDAMRLRTARQPQLIEQVRSQLILHLTQLQPFVQAMANELCSTSCDSAR